MKSFRPQLEELDSRVLPSTTPLAVAHAAINPHEVIKHVFYGRLGGTYTNTTTQTGAGVQLTGSGTFASLGKVQVTGSLQALSPTQAGFASGGLTLSNAQGSLTLQLVPVKQDLSSSTTSSSATNGFMFTFGHGTGGLAGLTGFGELSVQLLPAAGHTGGQFVITVNYFRKS
jgi:hypothetical protein